MGACPGWWHATATSLISLLVSASAARERGDEERSTGKDRESAAAQDRLAATLALSNLEPLGSDAFETNAVAFDPHARALGEALFSDRGLSRDGRTSCARCHDPAKAFASAEIVPVPGKGPRTPPSLLGVAWHDFFLWDGRRDSLWAQALGPLTSPGEHGLTFDAIASRVRKAHARAYRAAFHRDPATTPPTRVAVDAAKAIAAYETTLVPRENPLDRYLAARAAGLPPPSGFDPCARRGLAIFLDKGRCVSCHNGPLLTNRHFHNTGVPRASSDDAPLGFFLALVERDRDPFRCEGSHADRPPGRAAPACDHVRHAVRSGSLAGAFKTPSLRGVPLTAPYMHNGVYSTLEAVVEHYDKAPPSSNGESELFPLGLTLGEKGDLVCFLKAL